MLLTACVAVERSVVFWALLGVIAAARVAPIIGYFHRFWRAAPENLGLLGRARAAAETGNRCTGIVLYGVPEDVAEEVRQETLVAEARRVEVVLVGGSIALAAWTQLFVSSTNSPANRLSGTTLSLLFSGATVLLLVPLLFRTEGRLLTAEYRELTTYVGFGAVVLSLCSAITDLRNGWYVPLAFAIAAALLIRELLELHGRSRELAMADFPTAFNELNEGRSGDQEPAERQPESPGRSAPADTPVDAEPPTSMNSVGDSRPSGTSTDRRDAAVSRSSLAVGAAAMAAVALVAAARCCRRTTDRP